MKTDKQVYALFAANPRWLFELTGLPWPGPCQWKSETFKELEQSSDGIIAPQDLEQPLTVVEVQHPLVAVFRPVLQDDSEILGKHAAEYYKQIKHSNLPSAQIETLLKVFYFCNPKEIEEMLVGALPELRETQSGKDLIAIGKLEGKLEGKAEGKADSLLLLVEAKFGPQSEELQQRILALKSIEHINRLLVQAVHGDSIEQLKW